MTFLIHDCNKPNGAGKIKRLNNSMESDRSLVQMVCTFAPLAVVMSATFLTAAGVRCMAALEGISRDVLVIARTVAPNVIYANINIII